MSLQVWFALFRVGISGGEFRKLRKKMLVQWT